ncbi:MAG: winged helix-turn-helix domain-containing protein [Nitrososphaeria archaeon]
MPELRIHVSYGEVSAEFTGKDADEVLHALNSFLISIVPELELAKKLHVNYALRDLAEMFGDYVKLTPEGPRVMVQDPRMSDKQLIALQLVAARIAYELGKAERDGMTIQEIEQATALKPKSISSRLSELAKQNAVERRGENRSVYYRITTYGIAWLSKELAARA